ncbi:isoleucine--tRNA ligase [Gonapodya sp. JEL0774]|nr:isoleucine--tRNA ligase [Gonapodya sp. JEL0774]
MAAQVKDAPVVKADVPVDDDLGIASARINFPEEEIKILQFWKEIDAFKKQLEITKDKPAYTFYDGPPFATGLPHYGHLLAGTIKDVVTRYAAAKGFYVERRFGWDCHGLPVEHEIDKKLNIRDRNDVMAMGIDKYNAECRAIVMRYSSEWVSTVERIGRWIDFENDYKTLNTSFMESVWWVFKQLWDKDQVYRSFKIMPYSTACTTPLSNFEANQNYKEDVIDPAVVVSFPLVSDPKTAILAWTTTPWTLPSNLGLCVHPDFEYVKINDQETGQNWILLEKRLDTIYKDPKKAKFKVLERMKGKDLKGLEYVPLFEYFSSRKASRTTFRVLNDTYVTDEDGTGVVHQAPGFGEDDFRVAIANGVVDPEGSDTPCPVDDKGCFTEEITEFAGQYVKDADKLISKMLKDKGRMIRQGTLKHSYPFCWRSDTPLIYRAVPSWFVRVASVREKLLAANKETYWVPDFVQDKRFANWLENARDWSISRNRYWGTPIPLWTNADFSEIVCVGSIAELEKLAGVDGVTDLHRESIDHLTIPSKTAGAPPLRRIEEVLDCWFESGSMPYAQKHYPFENRDMFEKGFPADFIAEGLDQTRGWFYTLLVLSTHLFGTTPFKNVIVNGLVLAADGKKMSKRLKNYPEPNLIIDAYGADPLRLYLINSPVVRAEPLRFKEEGVKELIAQVFLPWYNAYRFFTAQVVLLKNDHGINFQYNPNQEISSNVMDRWILASCQSLIQFVRQEMEAYRLYTVVPRLLRLIDDLTNWYVRANRRRLKGENGPEDAQMALNALFEILFTLCRTMAPFTPFITELMYQGLRPFYKAQEGADVRSVHFLPFPEPNERYFDTVIERRVSRMQKVIEQGRIIRDTKTLPLKTPLRELVVLSPDPEFLEDVKVLEAYVMDELNIRTVTCTSDDDKYGVRYRAEPDANVLGKRLKGAFRDVKKALETLTNVQIKSFMETGSITVLGNELVESDLTVARGFDSASGLSHYAAGTDKEALILLDVTLDSSLEKEGLAREVMNRVQRMRKEAGLNPTDLVEYYWEPLEDPSGVLAGVMTSQADFLEKNLKQKILSRSELPKDAKVFFENKQEIKGVTFMLTFSKKTK